ncbi:MAG: hypothetical protein LV481_12040 [Methylacidiphilales bacterium]|nr:hypothetical protein [Candidatus Methylacidiphilales bacterium]
MSKSLPAQPSLRQLKIQAKDLLQAFEDSQPEAISRFTQATGRSGCPEPKLNDAHLVLAREYGFPNWTALKKEVERLEKQVEESLGNQFRDAVRSGNVSVVEALLKNHSALQCRVNDPLFDFGGSGILNAVNRKDRPMIDALLKAGANLNQKSKWEAGGFGVLDRVEDELGNYLISRGAEVDIHAAAHLGKTDRICALLDENPALVNAPGGDGGTPLHFARNVEVAELLLERGADVTMRDKDHNSTAAMWRINNKAVLYRLIEAGSPIDIFMACVHGDRALAERALREDPDCLSAFLAHAKGEGKFASDTGGNIYNWEVGHAVRPIPVAARLGHRALADFLLVKASPTERLIAYCLTGNRQAVEQLLSTESNLIAHLTKDEARALPDAVHFRDRESARLMLDAGFPITAKGVDGGDCLGLAAWHGDEEFVRQAIEKGASLENKDNNYSSTPLDWACHGSLHCWDRGKGNYPEVVKALIRGGANAQKQSELKKTGTTGWASPTTIEAFP